MAYSTQLVPFSNCVCDAIRIQANMSVLLASISAGVDNKGRHAVTVDPVGCCVCCVFCALDGQAATHDCLTTAVLLSRDILRVRWLMQPPGTCRRLPCQQAC